MQDRKVRKVHDELDRWLHKQMIRSALPSVVAAAVELRGTLYEASWGPVSKQRIIASRDKLVEALKQARH